ncbi:hypothetical protein CHUAL_000668 [Chamberlinius hualienensis]
MALAGKLFSAEKVKLNVVFFGIRPMLFVWRVLGLFPFTNFDSSGKIINRKINRTFAMVVIVVAIFVTEITNFLMGIRDRIKNNGVINFTYPVLVCLDRFAALLVIWHFLRRSSAIRCFIERWDSFTHHQRLHFKQFRFLSWMLLAVNFILVISSTAIDVDDELKTDTEVSLNVTNPVKKSNGFLPYSFREISSTLDLIYTAVGFHFAIYFCHCLTFGFSSMLEEVETLDTDWPGLITLFRNRYNNMMRLTDELNSLLSPTLLLVFIVTTVNLTADATNAYAAISTNGLANSVIILNKIVFRLIQITSLCWQSEQLFNMPHRIVSKLLERPLRYNTGNSRFQYELLQSSLTLRQPVLDLCGFANIGYGLFLQIIGLVVTYTILMAQIGSL